MPKSFILETSIAMGDRIKRIRNFRKMTMKELGMAVGFDESSADVRIAQYENNSRKPKGPLLRKIAEALNVRYEILADFDTYGYDKLMYLFFQMEDMFPSMRVLKVTDTTEEDYPAEHYAVCFRNRISDTLLHEWMRHRQELSNGTITPEEYMEWKLNWPDTIEERHRPSQIETPNRAWRNADKKPE